MDANHEADLDLVLGDLEDDWKKTPVPKDDRSPVPDGKYQVRVERVYLDCGQDGAWRLKWEFVILTGPCAKRHLFYSLPLTAQWIEAVKRDLARAGITPPETMRGLRSMIEAGELLDRVLEVQAKTKPGKDGRTFQNVYINGNNGSKASRAPAGQESHPDGEAAAGAPFDDAPPPGDDDVPF
jgi:hypothetical protein